MIKNFFNVAGADAVKRIAEWIRTKFYTKAEIDEMFSAGAKYEVVDELPSTGVEGTIYLVPSSTSPSGDIYDEYIYVDGDFEKIGTTKADLANVVRVPTAGTAVGDTTHPVYVDADGEATAGSQYAGGTKLTLNGADKGADSATAYAPTAGGTSGQYLKSNGNGNAPSWETMDSAPTENSTKAVTSGGVKTALDGKQASISISTNANTPTDNDTVIMQDNDNTGTTSFLRRKLSTLWTYIKGKADEFYFSRYDFANFPNYVFLEQKRYFQFFDDRLWGADQRFNVTWNTYDSETHENLNYTHTVANLFNHNFENYHAHPQTGEYDVIRIYPKTEGGTLGWTYGTGWLFIFFYYISYPEVSPIVRIYGGRSGQKSWTTLPEPTKVTAQVFKYSLSQQDPALYLEEIEITITGKTFPNESSAKGCGVSNICYIPNRAPIADSAIVTKYGVTQSFYGNIIAPKFQTRGGTSSQYLRGDGSLTALSTTPTSGSTIPITSGGVYTNTQSKLSINIPDNSGYRVMQLIADVTDSFNAPNYNLCGLVGYIYQWRYGATGTIPHRITAIGAHDASQVWLYTDCDLETRALLPYLVKYNNRYYIALKKNGSSRSGIRFVGFWTNLLSEPINLYANSTASKWYSDSGRTTEVTFEITKSYERYPNSYLNFGGTKSQVVTGTGELKTIDSSVASGSANLITSGAVASAIAGMDLSGKVNLQPDFTASQIDYSASNVGKWQKVLRFPDGADLVINMKKTAMGSDSTSTLWFSSSSMGDSYTSLFGNHSVRFVHDGGYVFLVLACKKSTNEPTEYYTFQIAHSSVPMSDIVAVTDASPITATPNEPNIVYRAPITTGAVLFNVNSSGAGSVSMSGHNDFLGNMTSEATNGVVVTMSGATEGQIYRFVFTRNIEGGVTFKQSNVAYCTISGDVNAGDTITLTAVSNTENGWLYEQESAGIESSDGSNIVEYNGSTADVRVNWDKLPARVVMNVADDDYEDDKNIAIGYGASTYKLTGDENYPYAYTTKATFEKMKVDGGEEEYTHAVTAGTTYSIVRGSVTTSFTPAHSGYAVILKMPNSSDVLTTQYPAQIRTATQLDDYAIYDKTLNGETEQYVIVVIPISANYSDNIGADSSYAIVWILSQNNSYNTACGYGSRASGSSSSAFGLRARANDASSLAAGADSLASDRYTTAAGDRARAEGRYSSAYGSTATANGEASSAIGASTNASGRYSTAVGHNATAKNYMSTAVGNGAMASGRYTEALGMSAIAGSDNSTALGSSSKSYGYCSTAVGNQTRAGLSSTDADRPYRRVKNFTAVQFTDGGDSVLAKQCETDDAVTIAVNGNSYTLTPPDEGYTLVVLNDANAQYINGIVTGYLKVNGMFGYYISNTQAVSTEVLSGNYCAVWIKTFSLPSEIASLSFVAYHTDPSSAGQYQTTLGYNSEAVGSSSVAVGHNVTATRDYQVVIGSGNLPDYDALFIVGAGGNVTNARKNILTVDYREQLQVKGVRTQVARMTTSGTISGVNNIYLIGSGCTVALPSTGEEGQVLKVCAEGNCTVGGVSLEAGKFREYVCAGGAWYTRE